MPIAVQTLTGTIYMEIEEYLRLSDEDFLGLYASNEIDPMSVKIPANSRDVTDDFDLPDLSKVEELDINRFRKRK